MSLRYSTPGVHVEKLDADPQRIRLRRTDVAGFVGIAKRGPLNSPVKIQTWRQFVSTFGGPIPDAYLAYAINGFFQNGGRTCWVVRAGDSNRATTATATLNIAGVGRLTLKASSPGAWGNELRVSAVWRRDEITALMIRNDTGRSQRIDLTDPDLAPDIVPLPGSSRALAGSSSERAWQTNLLGVKDSHLHELEDQPLVTSRRQADTRAVPLDAAHPEAALTGGADGSDRIGPSDLIGNANVPEERTGLAALERVDGVSIVAIPDLMIGQDPSTGCASFKAPDVHDAQMALMASCLRTRDRVALLDLPLCLSPRAAADYPKEFQSTSVAAVYYPWLVIDDPLQLRGRVRSVPPSGHVAGMFARIDQRRGVHKPPANETLEGAYDTTTALDDATHGTLNDAGVNAIRPVPGRGILVLGARTLDPDVKWRYVNVRRLFLMIEETLDEELQSLVFEPNNPQLWRDIRRVVSGFLDRLWRAGMLDGNTPEVAYTVRCDDSTNPPWETEQGRVTCLVGLQPPYPAEFVIVRIGLARDGVEIRTDEVRDG
jgi:uncharacterized protein